MTLKKVFLVIILFLTVIMNSISQTSKTLKNGLTVYEPIAFKIVSNKVRYQKVKKAQIMLVYDSKNKNLVRVLILIDTDIAYFHKMSEAYFYIDDEYSYKANLTIQVANKRKNTTALRFDGNFNFLFEESLIKIDIATGFETLTLTHENLDVLKKLRLKKE